MNSRSQVSYPPILRVFQSKDQTRAFYNKISHVYDLLSERSEAPMRKAGIELLKPKPAESIWEIGFGTGHTLVSLAKAHRSADKWKSRALPVLAAALS